MSNLIAYAALISWPLITMILFSKYRIVIAIFGSILAAHLILPVRTEFDLPLIPPMDKYSIGSISALVGCLIIHKQRVRLLPAFRIEKVLVLIILGLPFITMIHNGETVITDTGYVSGLTLHDTIAAIINQYIRLLPFILASQFVKSYEDLIIIFKILVVAALFYSLPILFEIRMSPQLHTWIYGYFPHPSFGQELRFGGFRPVVFIGHGLAVSAFISFSVGAAAILYRNKTKLPGLNSLGIILYLLVILLLCKSVGAFLFGTFLLLSILFLRPGTIRKIAIGLMLVVIFYPLLSIFNLFPHQGMVELAASFDAQRAHSLNFRFENESLLLERAQQKLFFGWGDWGRNRVPGAVTDGYWIIVFGSYGIIGFLAIFGLGLTSALAGAKAMKISTVDGGKYVYAGCVLLVTIIMIDQLPNSSISPWLWCIIGALTGSARNTIRVGLNSSTLSTAEGGKRRAGARSPTSGASSQ